jgi:hypothetical protein
MNQSIVFTLLLVGLFWGALFLTLKRVDFILAGASFLLLTGFLFLGFQQISIIRTPSDVASDTQRGLEDRQFSRHEVKSIIYVCASQIRNQSPNIFYSAIPISIGCFLIGRFTKK